MNETPEIVILCGGCSEERDVSLRSARAVEKALTAFYTVKLMALESNAVPASLCPDTQVIFPVMHGSYGEDGQLQAELEARGFAYAGSDARSSEQCMRKQACKRLAKAAGVPVLEARMFEHPAQVQVDEVIQALGASLVIKPEDSGSSVGLHLPEGEAALRACIEGLDTRRWMIEPRFSGRELTVGLLDGEPLGVVEIVCEGGVYDYAHKYQPGQTRYEYPAALDETTSEALRAASRSVFEACGCRDFARADFLLNAREGFIFLEINTIPGLTDTSLLPKSASCFRLDFRTLVRRMIEPAIRRHSAR